MAGPAAKGTRPLAFPLLEPECRGTQRRPDPKLRRPDEKRSEGRTGLLHSCGSAGDMQRQRVRTEPPEAAVELRELFDWSSLVYFRSLLMQSFSQVSDALIHHGHLGVPLVQQLLVLGQLAALLQVMTVTSLRHAGLQASEL